MNLMEQELFYMMWNSKKFAVMTALSTVAITCLLNAADDAQMRNLENRVSALEGRRNAGGIINPPARPTQKDDWGAYITVDPLLWQAHVNGLGFAVKTDTSSVPVRVRNLHFDWDWGFRAGLGLNLPYDGWDLFLDWTRVHNHAHKTTHADTGETLLPSRVSANAIKSSIAQKSEARWRSKLNIIDLDLGREFFVSKWLTLKPFAGIRTMWLHQKFNANYSNINDPNTVFAHQKCKYWGLGIHTGLNTQWGLGEGWSIFANTAFSNLYGFFSVRHEDASFNSATNVTTIALNEGSHERIGRVINDNTLGIRYDYMFCDDRYHFGVDLFWELHMFFGQNQFLLNVDDTAKGIFIANQGDFTAQGFGVRLRFDF